MPLPFLYVYMYSLYIYICCFVYVYIYLIDPEKCTSLDLVPCSCGHRGIGSRPLRPQWGGIWLLLKMAMKAPTSECGMKRKCGCTYKRMKRKCDTPGVLYHCVLTILHPNDKHWKNTNMVRHLMPYIVVPYHGVHTILHPNDKHWKNENMVSHLMPWKLREDAVKTREYSHISYLLDWSCSGSFFEGITSLV